VDEIIAEVVRRRCSCVVSCLPLSPFPADPLRTLLVIVLIVLIVCFHNLFDNRLVLLLQVDLFIIVIVNLYWVFNRPVLLRF
jgi:hypothetical protein